MSKMKVVTLARQALKFAVEDIGYEIQSAHSAQ